MNGYQLASAIRESGDRRPIFGVTANAMRDEQRRCREAGMTSWLVKPVQLRTLWSFLARYAESGQEDTAPAADPSATAAMDLSRLDGLPDDFRQVFISTMADDLQKLDQAAAGGDRQAVQGLLHRIRGGLMVAGFGSQASALGELDKRLRDGAPIGQAMADAGACLDSLRQAVTP